MDILYTVNKDYVDIMLASFISVYENANFDNINIHIIYNDLDDDCIYRIERILNELDNVSYHMYQMKEDSIKEYGLPDWRGNQIANARLFFERVIPDLPEKLLYLDADTICLDSLDFSSFNDYSLYATLDSVMKSYLRSINLSEYYNSGVLYFNMDKWINEKQIDKIINFLKNNELHLTYPDQDTLNIALKNNIGKLPLDYNVFPYPYLFNDFELKAYYNEKIRTLNYQDIKKIGKNPRIIHSTGLFGIKPWHKNHINPFNQIYRDYINKINPDFILEDVNKYKRIFSYDKRLFIIILLIKTYLPENIEKSVSKVTLNLQNKKN